MGGGIGGLSTACRLAAAGLSVTLYEKNSDVGGKMRQVESEGYRWDTGPSVLTMRHVLEDLFSTVGRALEDYITLLPLEPLTRYFYRDGQVLDASADWPTMARQIDRLEQRDVAGYLQFLAFAANLHRITGPVFIYDQPPSIGSFSRAPLLDVLRIKPWRTMDHEIRRHFKSPHLRQLMGRFATYAGASPYSAPAALCVIADIEMTGGVWYPKGGVYAIASALEQVAKELGVEIHTNTTVDEILVQDSRAVGISLADNSRIHADRVVANVDVAEVYHKLLPPGTVSDKARRRLAEMKTSCSGFAMLLGVQGTHPQLAHHNIFFSSDYRREFREIFDLGLPPSEPTVYVAITSKTDPTHAPKGCENWFVLVNAPAIRSGFDWQTEADNYRDVVLDTLKHYGLDISEDIQFETIISPVDIAQATGAWRGALYGTSSNYALSAFRRPHNRCPDVGHLFFVGGTTHPGGGIPMVILSSSVVTNMILSDMEK